MPLFLIPLFVFTVALLGSISSVFFVAPAMNPPETLELAATPALHYTRSGIVSILPSTGATRFTPYSRAPEFDRRRSLRT